MNASYEIGPPAVPFGERRIEVSYPVGIVAGEVAETFVDVPSETDL